MTQKRRFSLAALAAVALLVVGCQPLANIGESGNLSDQHYIKLAVEVLAAGRAITVTGYQVTGMSIEVRDPDNAVVDTIAWDASEGDATHMIPVSKTGEYKITVTHNGEQDGKTVQAIEQSTFTIGAMVITEISIVPGSIGVIHVQGDATQPVAADGTLTLHLTDVEAPDGARVACAVFSSDVDWADPLPSRVAAADGYLEGGSLDTTAKVLGPLTTWVGTGGATYEVVVFVDMNNSSNDIYMAMYPEPGIDLQLVSFPFTILINGNTDLYFTGADFITVPAP